MATVPERLNELAIEFMNAEMPAYAEQLCELAREVEDLYVPADTTGEIPTNAQGVALARFLRPAFRGGPRDRYASVSRAGAGLPDDYIFIRLADGYEGGIDREGRTST